MLNAYNAQGQKLWRLGTTSCIYEMPLLENVRRLAGKTEDIELIYYDNEWGSNWPSPSETAELRDLAAQHNMSYTVHIPSALDGVVCSREWEERAYAQVGRTIEFLEDLAPAAYVWHWEAELRGKQPSADVPGWLGAVQRLAERVAAARWIPPRRLAVETLSYPFELIADLVSAYDFGITLDVGHLWAGGYDWERSVKIYGPRTKVVHLHGIEPDTRKDHNSLIHQPPEQLLRLGNLLANIADGQPRTVTLEVFAEDDWLSSQNLLRRLWQCL